MTNYSQYPSYRFARTAGAKGVAGMEIGLPARNPTWPGKEERAGAGWTAGSRESSAAGAAVTYAMNSTTPVATSYMAPTN